MKQKVLMSSPKMALVLIASLALGLSACSKDDKSTPKESILKQSTKPGYLPDGTKVAELSDEEMKQVLSSVEGANQVITALDAAMEEKGTDNGNGVLPGVPGVPRRMSLKISSDRLMNVIESKLNAVTNIRAGEGYSEELKKELLVKCTFDLGESKTDTSEASRSGNVLTGRLKMTQKSQVSGSLCPVIQLASVETNANFSATLNSQDEMTALSATGSASVINSTKAKPVVAQRTGFVGMDLSAKLDGSIQSGSGNMRMNGEASGDVKIETLEMGVVSGRVLGDIDVSGNESSSAGQMRVAMMLTAQGKTVLIQIFAIIRGEDNSTTEVYINGKKVDPETLK